MFKKILAAGLTLSIILSAGTFTGMAAGIIVDNETFEVDKVESTDAYGVVVAPQEDRGNAGATVKEDVTVNASDKDTDISGVGSISEHKQTSDATVDGDVTVNDKGWNDNAYGVEVRSDDESHSSASVGGDVSVSSYGEHSGLSTHTSGIYAENNGGDIDVSVDGNVNVSSDNTGNRSDSIATGISAQSTDGGQTNIEIGKNVTVDGEHDVAGIEVTTEPKSEDTAENNIDIIVHGDVTSSGDGMKIKCSDGGTVDVVIEGTLSATDDAIVLEHLDNGDIHQEDRLNITVWKIESGDKEQLVKSKNANGESVSDNISNKVEKSINYIIKVAPEQKDSITLLSGIEKNNGFDTAHEGDNVAVKLNIPSGYYLSAAYSDSGKNIKLLKNESGDYYLVVPKGGGVYVNMVLNEIIYDNSDYDNDDDDDNESTYKPDIINNSNSDPYTSAILEAFNKEPIYNDFNNTFYYHVEFNLSSNDFIFTSSMIEALCDSDMRVKENIVIGFTDMSIPLTKGQSLMEFYKKTLFKGSKSVNDLELLESHGTGTFTARQPMEVPENTYSELPDRIAVITI
ncbi:hypothetical protein UYO_2162 [Lachnospiraceae bacterium JC7]|nr:hypothetical protein UYO_2162 [Lachnospiraceae bacterium JC7]